MSSGRRRPHTKKKKKKEKKVSAGVRRKIHSNPPASSKYGTMARYTIVAMVGVCSTLESFAEREAVKHQSVNVCNDVI